MSLLAVAGANSSVGGYDIDNSLKLEPNNNEWLYNASPTAGNRQTHTISFWIKRSGLGTVNASGTQYVMGQGQHGRMFFTNDYFSYRFDDGHDCRNVSRQFRDTSAWYHFVVAVDTTQATSSNRVKLYVNGETLEVDDHDGGSYPDQTDQGEFLSTDYFTLGTAPFGGSYNAGDGDYDTRGYLAEVCIVDGQQLAPTDFGEYDDNGIWIPKDVSSINFGSEGFYLDFENSSSLGADASGNGNDLTENNLTAVDQATDTPTNNFCTLNPLQGYHPTTNEYFFYTEGNTRLKNTLSNVRGSASTISVNKGKWYAEWKYTAGTSKQLFVGILAQDKLANEVYQNAYSAATTCTWYPKQELAYYRNNGTLVTASATRNSTIAAGDVIGMFLDMDNNHLYFQKNGSDINVGEVDASTLLFKESNLFDCNDQYVCFYANVYDSTNEITWNFGGLNLTGETTSYSDANNYGAFKYEPVRGSDNYYALCTKNLSEYG